ncbi:MAG: DUF502 domain-containing protein [Bacteroidetes bacterium]|nr:DUF502 domain-containing protein [Bacteroidota bacterium]
MKTKSLIRTLLAYFFQGMLLSVPVAATIWVLYKLFLWIDGIIPFDIPGIGFIVLIAGITFMGYLSSFYFMQPLYVLFEKTLERAPLAKIIYSSIKDMIKAFVGEKKRFTQPVLVTVNKESGVQQIGFITQNDLTGLGLGADKVAVYFPFPYSFMGVLYIVPKENITLIDASGTEMMKFIVSGGVTEIEKSEGGNS